MFVIVYHRRAVNDKLLQSGVCVWKIVMSRKLVNTVVYIWHLRQYADVTNRKENKKVKTYNNLSLEQSFSKTIVGGC